MELITGLLRLAIILIIAMNMKRNYSRRKRKLRALIAARKRKITHSIRTLSNKPLIMNQTKTINLNSYF